MMRERGMAPQRLAHLSARKQPAITTLPSRDPVANRNPVSSSRHAPLDTLPVEEQATWIIPVIQTPSPSKAQGLRPESGLPLLRNLVKSSGSYALASLIAPLISLVLAPFLTHSFSHADYGALVVLNTVIALIGGVTQLGMNPAIFRAYNYDYESRQDRLGVISTSVVLLSCTSIPTALAIGIVAPWLASLLLSSSSFETPVKIAALVVLVQNLTVPGFAWLRAENRALFFSSLTILNLLVSLGMTVILVGFMRLGITGSLLATGAGYTAVVICTVPLILFRAGLRCRLDITRNLLSFGVPLIFGFVSYWVLQLSDRYLLGHMGSLVQTASYGVAYNLGGALTAVILSPFTLAWPTALFAIAKRKDAAQLFQLVFRRFSMVLLMAAFGLTLLSVTVLDVLFPPSYHEAAPVIPIIALSNVFYGVYNIFLVGISVRRKMWFAPMCITLSALVNVGCNLILIPFYGSMGAALSTLIAYILLALSIYMLNQRIYPIPFEIDIFAVALLIGIGIYIGSCFLAQHETLLRSCAIDVGSLALYSGCLLALGKLPARGSGRAENSVQEDFVP